MSPLLNESDRLYFGSEVVSKLYLGSTRLWPEFIPTDLSGLSVWLDAAQLPPVVVGANERMMPDTQSPITSTGSYNLGTRFVPSVDGQITHGRYWHTQSCADTHYLSVWDVALGTRIGYVADIPGGVTGWREKAFVSPIPVKAGRTYVVSYSTTHAWSYTTPAGPTSIAPSLGSPMYMYAAYDSIPSNPVTTSNYLGDCVFQTTPGGDVGPWPNLAPSGLVGALVGTPAPRIIPNSVKGFSVVRFVASQGRLRFSSIGITTDWTMAYVSRMLGPTAGRIDSHWASTVDALIGYHGGNQDAFYGGAWAVPETRVAYTNSWKLYSADSPGRFFSNGVYRTSTAVNLNNILYISGYNPTGAEETSDCEVAEFILYNRKLSDTDRQKVETYLRKKWGF